MLCERCKIREANIQYTEVINGVRTEHNFCAQCAKELDFGPYSAIFDSDFPLGKLLSGLLGVGEQQQEQKAQQVVCPTCKTSYEEFIKNSRFGCADCYGVFDLLIGDNIKQLQGSGQHKGKRPKYHIEPRSAVFAGQSAAGTDQTVAEQEAAPEDPKERLRVLEARLQEALVREEYETAAVCRDQIRALREEMQNDEMV
ncbi:MAG: UvrB/UvrC motif-containing protein [Clostridiales bacterium]|nr:UvrB/UvrC motif-containing protein [Clostridiales bacterium]